MALPPDIAEMVGLVLRATLSAHASREALLADAAAATPTPNTTPTATPTFGPDPGAPTPRATPTLAPSGAVREGAAPEASPAWGYLMSAGVLAFLALAWWRTRLR